MAANNVMMCDTAKKQETNKITRNEKLSNF